MSSDDFWKLFSVSTLWESHFFSQHFLRCPLIEWNRKPATVYVHMYARERCSSLRIDHSPDGPVVKSDTEAAAARRPRSKRSYTGVTCWYLMGDVLPRQPGQTIAVVDYLLHLFLNAVVHVQTVFVHVKAYRRTMQTSKLFRFFWAFIGFTQNLACQVETFCACLSNLSNWFFDTDNLLSFIFRWPPSRDDICCLWLIVQNIICNQFLDVKLNSKI